MAPARQDLVGIPRSSSLARLAELADQADHELDVIDASVIDLERQLNETLQRESGAHKDAAPLISTTTTGKEVAGDPCQG